MRKGQIEYQFNKEQRKAAEIAAFEENYLDAIIANIDYNACSSQPQQENKSYLNWLNIVSQAVQIAQIQQEGSNTANTTKIFVVLHLQYFLQIADNCSSLLASKPVCTNFSNVLSSSKKANIAVGIAANIFQTTIDNWKAMQKSASNEFCATLCNTDLDTAASNANQNILNAAFLASFEPIIGIINAVEMH